MAADVLTNLVNLLLDPIFKPLLALPPAWSIAIITFIITLLITLIHKKFSDQDRLKKIREDMKSIQKQMREHKNDPAKVMALQKQSMSMAGQQMKMQFKPMLITFIPIIVIFAWFSSHLAYNPIIPGEEFTTSVAFVDNAAEEIEISVPDGINLLSEKPKIVKEEKGLFFKQNYDTAVWVLEGETGEYILTYEVGDKAYSIELLVTNEKKYKTPVKPINDGVVRSISIDNKPVKVFGLSWFWAYLIFAMVLSIALRKVMKVH